MLDSSVPPPPPPYLVIPLVWCGATAPRDTDPKATRLPLDCQGQLEGEEMDEHGWWGRPPGGAHRKGNVPGKNIPGGKNKTTLAICFLGARSRAANSDSVIP